MRMLELSSLVVASLLGFETHIGEYNPGLFNNNCQKFGLIPGIACDLQLPKPDGSGENWDLSKESDKALCWSWLEKLKPFFIIGSPMCAAFSSISRMVWEPAPVW